MTDSGTERRRGGDQVQEQIEKLILTANDPKDKALLLIMNKIAISLDTNTYLTQGLSDEFRAHSVSFKKHEETAMGLINKGKGGILVGIWLLGVIQVLGGFVVSNQLDEIRAIRHELAQVQETLTVHKENIKTLNFSRIP